MDAVDYSGHVVGPDNAQVVCAIVEGEHDQYLIGSAGQARCMGLAEKIPSPTHPGRDNYQLTPRGKSLRPVLMAMVKWGLDNIEGSEAMMKSM